MTKEVELDRIIKTLGTNNTRILRVLLEELAIDGFTDSERLVRIDTLCKWATRAMKENKAYEPCINCAACIKVSTHYEHQCIFCYRLPSFDGYLTGKESFFLPTFVTGIECKHFKFKYNGESILDLEKEGEKKCLR